MPLQYGDKYALLAFEHIRVARSTTFPIVISDRVEVLNNLPVAPADYWKQWLGTLQWESMQRRSTLIVLTKEPNQKTTELDHSSLENYLTAFHHSLLLTGVPRVESVSMLVGNVDSSGPHIAGHTWVHDYGINRTMRPAPLDEVRIRQVAGLTPEVVAFNAAPWTRIKKGFLALLTSLRMEHLDERLHLMIRAMDAVIKTEQGQGRAQFAERCSSMFLSAHPDNLQSLNDMYFLRNAVEHVKDIDDEPSRISDPVQRKEIRNCRLRQLEVMTLHVYRRVIGDPGLRLELSTDAGIDNFWAPSNRAANVRRWNSPLDLSAIP